MKLLLTSSGFATPALEAAMLKLAGKARGELRSVFIPTAADPELDKSFVDSARAELRSVSKEVREVDLKATSESELDAVFDASDLVLVNGGNTFYLLHHVNSSGFGAALLRFLKRGGVYVGVSAGSILASPTIETAGIKGYDDPKVVELPSLAALALVPFHLFVHYQPHWDKLIVEETGHIEGELIKLADGDAVLVHGTHREVIRNQPTPET